MHNNNNIINQFLQQIDSVEEKARQSSIQIQLIFATGAKDVTRILEEYKQTEIFLTSETLRKIVFSTLDTIHQNWLLRNNIIQSFPEPMRQQWFFNFKKREPLLDDLLKQRLLNIEKEFEKLIAIFKFYPNSEKAINIFQQETTSSTSIFLLCIEIFRNLNPYFKNNKNNAIQRLIDILFIPVPKINIIYTMLNEKLGADLTSIILNYTFAIPHITEKEGKLLEEANQLLTRKPAYYNLLSTQNLVLLTTVIFIALYLILYKNNNYDSNPDNDYNNCSMPNL